MSKWLKLYNRANPQIKYFILNWFVYGLVIIITTVYCYGRLDFVRSYRTPLNHLNETKPPESK